MLCEGVRLAEGIVTTLVTPQDKDINNRKDNQSKAVTHKNVNITSVHAY